MTPPRGLGDVAITTALPPFTATNAIAGPPSRKPHSVAKPLARLGELHYRARQMGALRLIPVRCNWIGDSWLLQRERVRT
jgi:hypothetical protein